MSPTQEEDATDTASAATRHRNHDAPYEPYDIKAKRCSTEQQRALRGNNGLFGANQQRNYIGGIERHDVTYPPLPTDGLA